MTFSMDDGGRGSELHKERTQGLTEAEKALFNDGYLFSTGDALNVIEHILDDTSMSDAEKVEAFGVVLGSMTLPVMLASLASGKNYLG